mmetsp:Transcript_76241/g.210398  ORF Transcript_76241/g.210398 Transcript_76241/m.210398 type:complete len:223 (-) Transcript_76241:637-1305(-)
MRDHPAVDTAPHRGLRGEPHHQDCPAAPHACLPGAFTRDREPQQRAQDQGHPVSLPIRADDHLHAARALDGHPLDGKPGNRVADLGRRDVLLRDFLLLVLDIYRPRDRPALRRGRQRPPHPRHAAGLQPEPLAIARARGAEGTNLAGAEHIKARAGRERLRATPARHHPGHHGQRRFLGGLRRWLLDEALGPREVLLGGSAPRHHLWRHALERWGESGLLPT